MAALLYGVAIAPSGNPSAIKVIRGFLKKLMIVSSLKSNFSCRESLEGYSSQSDNFIKTNHEFLYPKMEIRLNSFVA